MKYLTEQEILQRQIIDFDYCSFLEEDGTVSLDELSDLIPGYIHLNHKKNGGMEYLSRRGLDILEKSMEEVRQLGSDFVLSIADKRSQKMFELKRLFFADPEKQNSTFSYIQRLKYDLRQIPFKMFYTTSKLYRDGKNTLSFSQPLHLLHENSYIKEIIEHRYIFFNKNYFKFNLLTPRECEILALIAAGDDNQKIAQKLFISTNTVKTHRKNICRKLETGKLIELVQYAQVFLAQDC